MLDASGGEVPPEDLPRAFDRQPMPVRDRGGGGRSAVQFSLCRGRVLGNVHGGRRRTATGDRRQWSQDFSAGARRNASGAGDSRGGRQGDTHLAECRWSGSSARRSGAERCTWRSIRRETGRVARSSFRSTESCSTSLTQGRFFERIGIETAEAAGRGENCKRRRRILRPPAPGSPLAIKVISVDGTFRSRSGRNSCASFGNGRDSRFPPGNRTVGARESPAPSFPTP